MGTSPAFPSLFFPWSVSLTGYRFINLHSLVDRAFSLSGLERCCSPNFSLALFPVTDLCHRLCISVTCLSSLVSFHMVSLSLVSSILTIMCLRVLCVCVSGGFAFLSPVGLPFSSRILVGPPAETPVHQVYDACTCPSTHCALFIF